MPHADRAVSRMRPRDHIRPLPPSHDALRQIEEILAAYRASVEAHAHALALLHEEVRRHRAATDRLRPAAAPPAPRSSRRSRQTLALPEVEHHEPDTPILLSPLTRREWQVAQLVARGLTNRQIAERLILSRGTVANHVEHIRQKLGTRSRSGIAAWAVQHRDAPERSVSEPQPPPIRSGRPAAYTARLVSLADSDVA